MSFMQSYKLLSIVLIVLIALPLAVPASVAQATGKLKVVCTTSVLMDPVTFIGGEKVEAISIADPTLCPHLQADIVPNRIQLNSAFIRSADMYVAYGDSNDKSYNMPAVDNFMNANGYGNVTWITVSNPSRSWNTPETSKLLAAEVKGWLVNKTPANRDYYEQKYNEYVAKLDAVGPTAAEKAALGDTEVIVMVWQQDPVQNWLGMKVVNIFAPDFYMNGAKTAAKLVDDINANTSKYRNVKYVIENKQSTELAKGVEEALKDKGINAKRVIFTNFPGSVPNTATMADVLTYNKNLVLQGVATPTPTGAPAQATAPTATPAPAGMLPLAAGLLIGAVLVLSRVRKD